MHPDIEKLINLVASLAAMMDQFKEDFWAQRLRNGQRFLLNQDYYGVQYILASFSGQDSLTDFYLHPLNGNPINENQVAELNGQVKAKLSEIYDLASKLRIEEEGN